MAVVSEKGHLPALDGLRGLAIALVMLAHFTDGRVLIRWAAVAQWGGIGVDLFFVLSGFLITGILLDSRGSPTYFRAFYARRVLRIFPLYYAFVALLLLTARHATPAAHAQLVGAAPWLFGYMSNVFLAIHGWSALPPSAGISWSLAIEEQFYLVWPAVVLLAGPRRLPRVAFWLVVSAWLIRLALRLAGAPAVAVYTLTPAHMDGLAVGAFVAVAYRERERFPWLWTAARPVALAAAVVLFGLLAVEARGLDYGTVVQLVGYGTFAAGFGGLLVLTLRPGAVQRAMAWEPLCFLGRYSYALYLVHRPAVWAVHAAGFTPRDVPTQLLFYGAASAVAIAGALASWHLWEKHFLALKRFVPYGRPGGSRVATPGRARLADADKEVDRPGRVAQSPERAAAPEPADGGAPA